MKKRSFNLVMPEEEAARFKAKCAECGRTRTDILRSLARGYSRIEGTEFIVLPVMPAITLGRLAKGVSDA